jgi:hypothetical protein
MKKLLFIGNKRVDKSRYLNRLEHHLLSMQVDDIEPLFILYVDTISYIEEANLDLIVQGLVKLFESGYSICKQKKWGRWRLCKDLREDILKRRFLGLSEEKRKKYTIHFSEYYFEITEKGRLEEQKDIYNVYYRQK